MNNKFKVIAMGRVGTLAANRYISAHPQISLPSFNDVTKTFGTHTGNMGGLFASSDQQISSSGIIIHDAVFFDKKHRKKLAIMNNIKINDIIHFVRNPYEMTKSWINHINSCHIMGILGWGKIPPSAEGFHSQYPEHFQTMKPGLQCRTFYKNYKGVKVIDFEGLMSEKIEETMADIYQLLGVDTNYKNEMLHDKQNTFTRELLQKGIDFRLNNEVIEMGMAPIDLFFHKQKDTKPWVTIHDTEMIYDLCPTLPRLEGDLVFIPKSNQRYNKLSYKTRRMLNEGIKDIVGEVLPVWAKNAEKIAQDIKAIKLQAISKADHAFVTKMLKEDMDIFGRYHPELKTLWEFG